MDIHALACYGFSIQGIHIGYSSSKQILKIFPLKIRGLLLLNVTAPLELRLFSSGGFRG